MIGIYVGEFENIKESKSTEKKLKSLGVTPYLFSKKGKYTFKAGACTKEEQAKKIAAALKEKGFDVVNIENL